MPVDITTEPLLVIKGGRIYRQNVLADLGEADTFLQDYFNKSPRRVPAAFFHDGEPVHAVVKNDYTTLYASRKTVPLRTTFSIREGVLTPEFAKGENFLERSLVWTAPSDMKLFFAARLGFSEGKWFLHFPYLWARNGQAGFYKLPLPNFYSDGRLCLGDTSLIRGESLIDTWDEVVTLFHGSTWNTDQLPTMAHAKAMFRFSAADLTTLPPTSSWASVCSRLSNQYITEIFPQEVAR